MPNSILDTPPISTTLFPVVAAEEQDAVDTETQMMLTSMFRIAVQDQYRSLERRLRLE